VRWRNLVGGASVGLRLRGKKFRGQAEVFKDDKRVAQGLVAFLKPKPDYAKYFDIALEEDGLPSRRCVKSCFKESRNKNIPPDIIFLFISLNIFTR
jgi:hypothetical protein